MEYFSVYRKYGIWIKTHSNYGNLTRTNQVKSEADEVKWFYRGARGSDSAIQGEAAAQDLHMDMDDRWQRTVWDGSHGSSWYSRADAAATQSIMSLEMSEKWKSTLEKSNSWNKMTSPGDLSQKRPFDEEMLSQNEFM